MPLNDKTYTLYVLKLVEEKYYVGITSQRVEKRFAEHKSGRKAYWTEKYPPIGILDQKPLPGLSLEEAKAFENIVTRRYIKQKGIKNVRGGDITNSSDMLVRFDYAMEQIVWESVIVILFLLLVITILVADSRFHIFPS